MAKYLLKNILKDQGRNSRWFIEKVNLKCKERNLSLLVYNTFKKQLKRDPDKPHDLKYMVIFAEVLGKEIKDFFKF